MILCLETPKKISPTKEAASRYNTHMPDMSREYRERWKAKHITHGHARVEIRKSVGGVDILIVVQPDRSVRISMNGPALMDEWTFLEFGDVVQEAYALLGV